MCGFAGYIDFSENNVPEATLLQRMCQAIGHRGYDGYAEKIEGCYGVGFRRLAIVDLQQGMQPFSIDNNRIILVCNGEIYNSHALKNKLKYKEIAYQSRTDTEVLLHLYIEYGLAFVEQLEGQFSIAIFDRDNKKVHLIRDPFGVCPLHYTQVNNTLIFGSEIKALLEHPLVGRKINLAGLDQILTLPGLVSPMTAFENIQSIPAGQCITFSATGNNSVAYWDLNYPNKEDLSFVRTESECLEGILEYLTKSIEYRMQSDIPVGIYLSGGLDSSLIAALMQKNSAIDLPAFSIGFTNQKHDESVAQKQVAAHLKLSLQSRQVNEQDIVDGIQRSLLFSECPVKESYNTCSWLLSQLAHQEGVQVILSGEGADELFGGYLGYRFDAIASQRVSLDPLEEALEEEAREAMWGDSDCFYEKNYALHRELKQSLYSANINLDFERFDCSQSVLIDPRKIHKRNSLHQRSYLDFKLRLVDHLVSDHGDRMGMANTVEVRYPFLDKKLVEFSTKIPSKLLLKNNTEKYLLKQVANTYLPTEIIQRQKFGFRAPGSAELLQQNTQWIEDYLSYNYVEKIGLFNADTIEHIKKCYRQPDFRLNIPYEDDILMTVATCHLFLETFKLSL